MDHIFGDSHDIAFGATPARPTHVPATPTPESRARTTRTDDFGDLDAPGTSRPAMRPPAPRAASPRPVEAREPRPFAPRPPQDAPRPEMRAPRPQIERTERPVQRATAAPEAPTTPALRRLIDGMKSSFLPREDDTSVTRMTVLSPVDTLDPLILVTRDDTTVLVGSGFGTMSRFGQEYTTFPDMRLVASEYSRLSAWILMDASIDVRPFQTILPGIGFPPIYATRDIIAKFRNNITDTDFLAQCRFFELFADGTTSRTIGTLSFTSAGALTLESGAIEIVFSHLPLAGTTSASAIVFARTPDAYTLGADRIESGEILSFRGRDMTRHTLKFTFDTFFLDKNSIGVVAGYTLGDREQLSESGVLIFTLEEDTRARTIAGHIFIDSRGFVHSHEMMAVHKEILKGIRLTYEKIISENPKTDRGTLVQALRREITKYCYLLTGRTPVVMPIVIER